MCPPPRVANIIAAAYICGADTIIRMFSFVLGPLSPFYDHVGTLTVPTPSVYIFFPSQPFSCIWFNLFFCRLFLMSNSPGDFQDKTKLEHT